MRRTLLLIGILLLTVSPLQAEYFFISSPRLKLSLDGYDYLSGTGQEAEPSQMRWNTDSRQNRVGPFVLTNPKNGVVVYLARYKANGDEKEMLSLDQYKKGVPGFRPGWSLKLSRATTKMTKGLGQVHHLELRDSKDPKHGYHHLLCSRYSSSGDRSGLYYFAITVVYPQKERSFATELTEKIKAGGQLDG